MMYACAILHPHRSFANTKASFYFSLSWTCFSTGGVPHMKLTTLVELAAMKLDTEEKAASYRPVFSRCSAGFSLLLYSQLLYSTARCVITICPVTSRKVCSVNQSDVNMPITIAIKRPSTGLHDGLSNWSFVCWRREMWTFDIN